MKKIIKPILLLTIIVSLSSCELLGGYLSKKEIRQDGYYSILGNKILFFYDVNRFDKKQLFFRMIDNKTEYYDVGQVIIYSDYTKLRYGFLPNQGGKWVPHKSITSYTFHPLEDTEIAYLLALPNAYKKSK